eukprot:scaffold281272_cov19-Prasinocladus_malaysianus.AAC.1
MGMGLRELVAASNSVMMHVRPGSQSFSDHASAFSSWRICTASRDTIRRASSVARPYVIRTV